MENSEQDVCVDVLFVAMTRPATVWGVPFSAFIIEFMGTVLIFLGVGNPVVLLSFIPIHAILYLVSSEDPGAFDSLFLWVQTFGLCLNRIFWGGASFSPLSPKRWPEN